MPLKKKAPKNCNDIENSAIAKSDSNSTMGRRSSTPLIICGDKLNKKMPQKINNCASPILLGKDETVPEPPGCIQNGRLKLGTVLGEGEYGFVYKGTYQIDEFKTVCLTPTVSSLVVLNRCNNWTNISFRLTLPWKPSTMNTCQLTAANSSGKPKLWPA